MFWYLVGKEPSIAILFQNIRVYSLSLFLLLDFRINSLIFKDHCFGDVFVISWNIWINLRRSDIFAVPSIFFQKCDSYFSIISISRVLYFIRGNRAHFLSLCLRFLYIIFIKAVNFPQFHILNGYCLCRWETYWFLHVALLFSHFI